MGSDTIPTRGSGTPIFAEWANVLKRVLAADLYPRNSSGLITNNGGSLGTSAYRWLNHYLESLKLHSNAEFVSIEAPSALAASYTLKLPDALPAAVQGLYVSAAGLMSVGQSPVVTASSGDWTNSGAEADVPNLSATVTTNGRPVLVSMQPEPGLTAGGDRSYISDVNGVEIRFYRDSSVISRQLSGATSDNIYSALIVDTPAAGTYTYKITANSIGGSTFRIRKYILVVTPL